ncbi:MAG: hypothetical protein ACREUR_08950 [Nitrosospira sp.]
MAIKFLAIDLAKNVFQLHGVDAAGQIQTSESSQTGPIAGRKVAIW